MAVYSDGSYGLDKGIYCSLPVICNGNFEYEIDKGVKLSEYGKRKLEVSH
jgi:malate dehydrogenase